MRQKQDEGYTLIEMMVVVALLAILMVGVIGLFLTNLKAGGKATAMARVKEEGDYAMSTIERTLRYAKDITGCDTGTGIMYKEVLTPTVTKKIYLDAAALKMCVLDASSNCTAGTVKQLTGTNVEVTAFTLTCTPPTATVGDIISISANVGIPGVTTLSETFNSRVVLRNN